MSTAFIRDAIRDLRAYTLEPREAPVKLDQNESPFDFPVELKRQVEARVAARAWNRYPDFETQRLRAAIALRHGLDDENVLAGNGSNELLLAAISTFVSRGSEVVIPVPTFALYEKLVTVAGGSVRRVPIDPAQGVISADALLAICRECDAAPVIIVCSPNNPTGGVISPRGIERLLESGATVVLDRAYGEFDGAERPPLHDRLVVLSTFSKAWGIAGLRVGWLSSTEETCREIRKVKLPYNMNVFSEEAAIVALENAPLLEARVAMIVAERERIARALASIPGVRPFPSRANFIAFATPLDPGVLFDDLLRAGVLVRNVSAYPGMQRCLRVGIGTPEENDRFIAALREALEERIS
ncbi:MAG TPA: histidinol-phosphate transaminase [Thermoanaerobaculia bacterium]|nr:histidinol-phosphate transaminase [Thermoanaerobaculia bacterium]